MADKTGLAGDRVELNLELYQRNLALLKASPKYWRWVERIEAVSLPDYAWVELSKTGDPLVVVEKEGHRYPLDSLHDPRKSAERWVSSLDLENRLHIYLIGLGSGYILEALRERVFDYIAVVCLDLSIFKLLLHVRDIGDWVGDERVSLILDPGDVDLLNALSQDRNFMDRVLSRPLIVVYPQVQSIYRERAERIRQLIRDNLLNARICLVTNVNISSRQLRNSLFNFPYFLKTPGMEAWYDWLKGVPVLCIAPGPSLKDSMEFVKQAKDHALLVAVDTAVPILQKEGIDPDVVVGLDFSPENARHYEKMDRERLRNSLLLSAVDVYETIFPMWEGLLSVIHMSHLFERFLMNKIGLFKGLTTAHTAFMYSLFSGADPIVFVGLDLSYPDLSRSHAEGATNKLTLKLIKDKRGMEYLAKAGMGGVKYVWARRIEGVDGREVISEDVFITYLRDFERIIDVVPVRVWDVKPRGARIKGTEHLDQAEAIERIKGIGVDVGKKREEMETRAKACNVLFDRTGFEEYWRGLLAGIGTFKSLLKEEFEAVERVRRALGRKEELPLEEMKKVNESIDRVFSKEYEDLMNLVQNFSAAVMVMIRKFFTLKKKVSHKERLDTILAFFEALMSGCDDVEALLKEVDGHYRKMGLVR